jgi:1-acyl-sn-glycerol-3-phosphate acyltransferase
MPPPVRIGEANPVLPTEHPAPHGAGYFLCRIRAERPGKAAPPHSSPTSSTAYLGGFNFLSKKLVNQAKTQSMRIVYRLPLMLLILLNLVFGLLILKAIGLPMTWRHRFLNAGKAVFLGMMGIKIRLREGSAPREAAILMANHRSYIDVLFFKSSTPQIYLSKIEVKSWPIIGWGAQALDVVFVDRSSKESRSASRAALSDRVRRGLSPVVFPEGTTTERGLLDFSPGMFYTAAELNVPIGPFVMEYSDPKMAWVHDDTFVSHLLKMLSRPAWSVDLYIGTPQRSNDGAALAETVRSWMLERVNK